MAALPIFAGVVHLYCDAPILFFRKQGTGDSFVCGQTSCFFGASGAPIDVGISCTDTFDNYACLFRSDEKLFYCYTFIWTMANSFSAYMGRSAKTKSLYTFSGKLIPGDFVALDEDGIGNFHHMGFVTYTGTYNTYNGKYYKDFRIAQHTNDYHEWVSSPINNWENYDGTGMYCIVRRSVS